MAARRNRLALTLLFALVGAQACKKNKETSGPAQVGDDIAQIEAALRDRDEQLQREGILVAYREPAREDVVATTPAPDEETPREEGDAPVVPDGGEPPPPVVHAPEPTDVDAKPAASDMESDAPALYSKKADRRQGRERKRVRVDKQRDDRGPRTRCERVCVLADTTCELSDRVCGLAESHPDDVRYEDACRRAEDQCESAMRHCQSCAA